MCKTLANCSEFVKVFPATILRYMVCGRGGLAWKIFDKPTMRGWLPTVYCSHQPSHALKNCKLIGIYWAVVAASSDVESIASYGLLPAANSPSMQGTLESIIMLISLLKRVLPFHLNICVSHHSNLSGYLVVGLLDSPNSASTVLERAICRFW